MEQAQCFQVSFVLDLSTQSKHVIQKTEFLMQYLQLLNFFGSFVFVNSITVLQGFIALTLYTKQNKAALDSSSFNIWNIDTEKIRKI